MPRSPASAHAREGSPICVRPGSAKQRARWESAAAEAGESLSDLVRTSIDHELERRREEAELEERRQAEGGPRDRWDELLERARDGVSGT